MGFGEGRDGEGRVKLIVEKVPRVFIYCLAAAASHSHHITSHHSLVLLYVES